MIKPLLALAAALFATGASADLMKPAGPTFVRGTIVAADPALLTVRATDGATVAIALAPGFKVATVAKIAIDGIKANSFIGTAAQPGKNGVLEATEVHIFPEAMRGLGEGHYGWDKGPASTMTNGNVGKVGTIKHHSGRTLTVDYKGGTQEIFVPANVPIVALAEGTPAALVPGAHVFTPVGKTPDGKPVTNQVVVGVGGVVPPM